MAWWDLGVLGAPRGQEVLIVNAASANKKGDVGEGTKDLHYHTLHKVGPWACGPSVAHGLLGTLGELNI